jgi:hypothetical protein
MTIADLMLQWLDSGDPTKVAHSRFRMAQPKPSSPRGLGAYFAGVRALNPLIPLPPGLTCLYASPGRGPINGGGLPIRCWAHYGCNCGGSHSDAAHCARCLKFGI